MNANSTNAAVETQRPRGSRRRAASVCAGKTRRKSIEGDLDVPPDDHHSQRADQRAPRRWRRVRRWIADDERRHGRSSSRFLPSAPPGDEAFELVEHFGIAPGHGVDEKRDQRLQSRIGRDERAELFTGEPRDQLLPAASVPIEKGPSRLLAVEHTLPVQPIERRHQRRIRGGREVRLQIADGRRAAELPECVEHAGFERAEDGARGPCAHYIRNATLAACGLDSPLLFALFFFSGACGLTYQVLWLRLLSLVFGVTVYAASTVLAAFMAGLALGSMLAGRCCRASRRPLLVFGVAEILIGLSALATPFELEAAASRLSRALPAAVRFARPADAGTARLRLRRAAAADDADGPDAAGVERVGDGARGALGSRIGALYAINTAGAVIGALLAGFI